MSDPREKLTGLIGRERTGRLLAELYQRGQLSWPAIARLTGIRQTRIRE